MLPFFSLSMGKRSVYIFPAAPAFALLAGFHAEQLLRHKSIRQLVVAFPVVIALAIIAAAVHASMHPQYFEQWETDDLVILKASGALFITGIIMLTFVILWGRRRLLLEYASSMLTVWLGLSMLVTPALGTTRSGADLIDAVDEETGAEEALGLVAWPGQFLLHWNRPATHFGYRREPNAEVHDAVLWLSGSPNRRLLLPGESSRALFRAGDGPSYRQGASQGLGVGGQ